MKLYHIILLGLSFFLLSCSEKDQPQHKPPSNQMLIIDSVITTTTDDHGFVYFQPPPGTRSNWKYPVDFYNGEFHYRFEVTSYPSQDAFMLSLCIWSDIVGNWERWKETCTDQVIIPGKGIYETYSVPSEWWIMNNQPVDFARADDFAHLGLVLWCENARNLSDWTPASSSCWEQRNQILPLTLRLTVVAVAKGHTFSGWEQYLD
jgi:hypothetical protein